MIPKNWIYSNEAHNVFRLQHNDTKECDCWTPGIAQIARNFTKGYGTTTEFKLGLLVVQI